jgi:hypothetical protein
MGSKRFIIVLIAAIFAADAPHSQGEEKANPNAASKTCWSYQPIKSPSVPTVKDSGWARTDIDRFILASLESHKLRPVPDAESDVLVRRLYFDLIGLPPTPEQIDAYCKDVRPDRYQRLVDQLLAAPQFGERWARHWLDVARFGESLTLRGFILKDAWRYRDFVIESFNSDVPYDRFMQEQIAGDLMPAKDWQQRRRQLTATSFLMLGNHNLEEQDKKQLEMDVVDEQIGAISSAFLAQTITCARCHDHKFDPISQRDYYALAGILHSSQSLEHSNVSKWIEVPLPMDPKRQEQVEQHERQVAELSQQIQEAKSAIARAKGSKILAVADLPGMVLDDDKAKQVGTWKKSKSVPNYIGDGYLTDNGDRTEAKTLTFTPEIKETAKFDVRLAYTSSSNRATNIAITVFSADGEKMLTVDEREKPPIDGHFVSLGQYTFDTSGQDFVLISNQGANGHVTVDALQFLPADQALPASSHANEDDDSKKAGQVLVSPSEIKQWEAKLKKLTEAGPFRDAVESVRESKEIADAAINIRGSVHSLGDIVPRGFPKAMTCFAAPSISANESGRLELAQWLADPRNPLPARVMANRIWHWIFGAGIVRTPDNFGTTGEPPVNPRLLDYLATKFVAGGWSIKSLVREIVLSHTYQRSSQSDGNGSASDPENRLQWRANRRRLDAECLRDAILSISGQMNPQAGGPAFSSKLKSDFGFKQTDLRRSVYLPVFRNSPPAIIEAFDRADPSVCMGRRNVSTVAPQSLFMLNDPFIIEQSRQAAERLLADPSCTDDASRLQRAYRLTVGRPPTAGEQRIIDDYLRGSTDAKETWAQVMHALFASMDFRYED